MREVRDLHTCSNGAVARQLPTMYHLTAQLLEEPAPDSIVGRTAQWVTAEQDTLDLVVYLEGMKVPDILGDLPKDEVEGFYVYQMQLDSVGGLTEPRLLRVQRHHEIMQNALMRHVSGGRWLDTAAWHGRYPIILLRLRARK